MLRNAGLFKPPHPGLVLAVFFGDEITLTEAATEFETKANVCWWNPMTVTYLGKK
jgi:hypothetical protein